MQLSHGALRGIKLDWLVCHFVFHLFAHIEAGATRQLELLLGEVALEAARDLRGEDVLERVLSVRGMVVHVTIAQSLVELFISRSRVKAFLRQKSLRLLQPQITAGLV